MSRTEKTVDPRDLVVRSSTIYDEAGMTRIPDRIREEMDITKGDKLKFIIEEGDMFVFIERHD